VTEEEEATTEEPIAEPVAEEPTAEPTVGEALFSAVQSLK
jgi:hypothetical protein